MQNNIPAVLSIMRYIYDNIMYAELNTKSDYCQVSRLMARFRSWTMTASGCGNAPTRGNRDQKRMNVCRRVWLSWHQLFQCCIAWKRSRSACSMMIKPNPEIQGKENEANETGSSLVHLQKKVKALFERDPEIRSHSCV